MSTATLLIEIGCEELPARHLLPLADTLAVALSQGLDAKHVSRGSSQVYATPRRIALTLDAVSLQQSEQQIERLGPAVSAALRDGEPTPAGLGFAKSCGVPFEQLQRRQTDKGEYLLYTSVQLGQSTADLLPELLTAALKQMDRVVPKRMRWGAGEDSFVRPVQWLCALLGEAVVPLHAFGLQAGRETRGHRFHAPAAIPLARAEDYAAALRAAYVEPEFAARRATIATQVQAQGELLGGTARMDADLLDEVSALVEWPVAIGGRFEERFLDVPSEAIVLTIQDNQRYFPVFSHDGALLPAFVTVANIDSQDVAQVVAGNERVVRPRLEDALFFWEQDLQTPLEQRLGDLARVSWAQGLGTLADKAERLATLCAQLAADFAADPALAAQAGRLAKCDLVTRMVFEMPELQGVMGGYYLRAEGGSAAVAEAIASHYRPAGPSEAVPESALGQLLSVCDKLDTVCGYFSNNAIPTASKDPFGLRRAALGVLRILLEGTQALSWNTLLQASTWTLTPDQRQQLDAFFKDRLRGLLTEAGHPAQVVAAVLPIAHGPLDTQQRAAALATFAATPAGDALAATSKRVRNILRSADIADIEQASSRPEVETQAAETALRQALESLDLQPLLNQADYPAALTELAALQAPIDAFFESVMVNVDVADQRRHRLALLSAFDRACGQVADFAVLASGS